MVPPSYSLNFYRSTNALKEKTVLEQVSTQYDNSMIVKIY